VRAEALKTRLDLWPGLANGRATLINHSENHTFRIDLDDALPAILRVHRPRYNSRAAIESELAWMDALRTDTGIATPRALAGVDGARVQWLEVPGEAPRHAVLFAFEEGVQPAETDDLRVPFEQLGALAALCHRHAGSWRTPSGFTRMEWTAGAILDPDGLWGDWRNAPNVTRQVRPVLDRLDHVLRVDLAAYGADADRYGLIHADMRLANLLLDGGETKLIDFDDCGFCWFGYDFAAAISFFEDGPQVPELRNAWLAGYRRHREFSGRDEAALETMVMLRRMALLAWTGSHAETELGRQCAPHFAQGTARLAERYLTTGRVTH